ncbi:cytochrome P450 [Amycolatopsis anabasis]|uniref:cytochrome P450 n=1 Tax=Amycolatopsis anabasis TaxID=1840409 RepID=UPI00131E7095|nr:cytochrome P450 [Amycolatopsis anabasis]
MTNALPEASPLPVTRPPGCPFDPPAELARIRAEQPISRLSYPDGHQGWLVTSRELARAVLADSRFSARTELMHMPFPDLAMGEEAPPAAPGAFTDMDPPEHTRYRPLLTGQFTVRRMRQLTEHIEQLTAERLDFMERQGPPADLVEAFAQPIPGMVICELLGVPYADREEFQRNAIVTVGNEPGEDFVAALTALQEYMRELVLAKRAEPTDDLLSGLLESDLTDEELTNIGATLLGAGVDTTTNMIALGTFALLSNPDQFAALRAEPDLTERAVEELLRYLTITHTSARAALADVELGGRLVKAGDTVTISLQAANRDPEQFADPDTLDLRRKATGHVAFGHGVHQCLGQQLARVAMRVAFRGLIDRFPTLRLAVPPEEIPMRAGLIHGVQRLPVAWDEA